MNNAASISLDQLSVTEKLVLMERIWDERSRRPADIPSPAWHGDILAARLLAVEEGTTSFVNWEDVKKRLRLRTKD